MVVMLMLKLLWLMMMEVVVVVSPRVSLVWVGHGQKSLFLGAERRVAGGDLSFVAISWRQWPLSALGHHRDFRSHDEIQIVFSEVL